MRYQALILLVLLPLFSSTNKPAVIIDCQLIYNEALNLENSNAAKAFQQYYKVCNTTTCQENVTLIDKAYRNAAKLAQKFVSASQYPDPCQRFGQGIMCVDTWLDYINWYSSLNNELSSQLAVVNIQNAIVQLGETIKKRGIKPASCAEENLDYAQIFMIYKDIDYNYFNAKSMNLWIEWLLRCKGNGKWEPQAVVFNQWATASGEIINASEWSDLSAKLGSWLETETATKLTPAELSGFRKKYDAITQRLQQ